MTPARSCRPRGLAGLRATGGETVQLVIDYIKQETLDPLKGLGRYVLFGVAGSVCLSIGLVVLAIALLRLLQGETGSTFAGNLSWVPYVICTIAVVGVAALAVWSVTRSQAGTVARKRGGQVMSVPTERITRDQIEAKFRELTGDVDEEISSARSQAVTVALAVGVAVVAVIFLIGRRAGRRRSAVVEVRRI